jgi:hypothetical protein
VISQKIGKEKSFDGAAGAENAAGGWKFLETI